MKSKLIPHYQEFMLRESMDQVKSLMPKMGLDYKRMINLPTPAGEPSDLEEVIAVFYHRLKAGNRLGHMTLLVRMVNDLRMVFELAEEKPDPGLIKAEVGKVFDLFLELNEEKTVDKLWGGRGMVDLRLFLKREDGDFWTGNLGRSLETLKSFRRIKRWVMTWPHKASRDMVVDGDFFNLDNMTLPVPWMSLVDRPIQNVMWGTTGGHPSNLESNMKRFSDMMDRYHLPRNKPGLDRFLEKLPTVRDFKDLVSVLVTIYEPEWGQGYWTDAIRSTKGARILWQRDGMMMVRVDEFGAINKIAWFTLWCIRGKEQWDKYNTGPWKQFVLYDFNKPYRDATAIIGFTADPDTGEIRTDLGGTCQDRLDEPTELPDEMAVEIDRVEINRLSPVSAKNWAISHRVRPEFLNEGPLGPDDKAGGRRDLKAELSAAVASADADAAASLAKEIVEVGEGLGPDELKDIFRAAARAPRDKRGPIMDALSQLVPKKPGS